MKTSDVRGAGTDANVSIMMYGEDADSGEIPLFVVNDTGDKFERDALDVFIVNRCAHRFLPSPSIGGAILHTRSFPHRP